MTPAIKETALPHAMGAAGSRTRQSARDCGLLARLGWDLGDLSEAVYHSSATVGSSLLVGEILASNGR